MLRALALFNGSLDSMLAVRAIQSQGIEVVGFHVRTLFGCGHGNAENAAEILGIPLVTRDVGEDSLDVFRRPRFGFGREKRPCVDCRIHICRMASLEMQDLGANFAVSGEILGQRSPGQRRKDLEVIARHSGMEGRLIRPLSALLLPETDAERTRFVDRSGLFSFHGSGRRELLALARRWNFSHIPAPSSACPAAHKPFAAALADLLAHEPNASRADFELLRIGRHVRFDGRTKIVLGRNDAENSRLRQFAERHFAKTQRSPSIVLLEPENYAGPSAIVVGNLSDAAIEEAARRIAQPKNAENSKILVLDGRENRTIKPALPRN
jgi:tRNA-uridine 2-sulfurtransferase